MSTRPLPLRRPWSRLSAFVAMAPHQSAQPLLGIALKVASTLVFTGMATLIKLVSDRYPVGELTFFRSFFALIPVGGLGRLAAIP